MKKTGHISEGIPGRAAHGQEVGEQDVVGIQQVIRERVRLRDVKESGKGKELGLRDV